MATNNILTGKTIDRWELLASVCEESLALFVKYFWHQIESVPYIPNWHIDCICEHLQAVTTGQIPRLLINVPPGCSKPCHVDGMVLEKTKGHIRLGDVTVGDFVLTHRGRFCEVLAVHVQGVLPVLKISTRHGRIIQANHEHPFLTPSGWKQAQNLQSFDVLAEVHKTEPCGSDTISLEEARLLGYLIGDGSIKYGSTSFTNQDLECVADFIECAKFVGFEPFVRKKLGGSNTAKLVSLTDGSEPSFCPNHPDKKGSWRSPYCIKCRSAANRIKKGKTKKSFIKGRLPEPLINNSIGVYGSVRQWRIKHGLEGKCSYDKRVPLAIMSGSDEIVAEFLAAYWACDGYISNRRDLPITKRGTRASRAGCCTVSEGLARDLLLLLSRMNLTFTLSCKEAQLKTRIQGDIYVSWKLDTNSQDAVAKFMQVIGGRIRHDKKNRDPGLVRCEFDAVLHPDSIKSVIENGVGLCCCLTVADDASFVYEGVAVHNSLLVSVFWPMWEWTLDPSVCWFYASYDQRLSTRDSVKCRALIASPQYQACWKDKFHYTSDENQKTFYKTDKGGWRLATSIGGHGTGEHPDRIVCFPENVRITTIDGDISIGKIVNERLPVQVLSFNHSRRLLEWKEIEEYEKSAPCLLTRIVMTDGTVLESTPDHAVYVLGKGYISASDLKPGYEVYHVEYESTSMPQLWGCQTDEKRSLFLLSQVFQQLQEKSKYIFMQSLWKACLSFFCSSEKVCWDFLQSCLSWLIQQRRESSFLEGSIAEGLCNMSQRVFGRDATKGFYCLQQGLFEHVAKTKSTSASSQFNSALWRMWQSFYNISMSHRQEKVLFTRMFSRIPQQKNERRGQPKFCAWESHNGILEGVFQTAQDCSEKGGGLLPSLCQDEEREWQGIRNPSHRLFKNQRLQGKFSCHLSKLSQQIQCRNERKIEIGKKIVSYIAPSLRVSDAVYNLRISENHNYFAEGVLVHNCDDANSVRKAESEQERQNVIDWWDLTMSTRGVTRNVRRVVIAQRLHAQDLSGHVLNKGDWVHLCLPMRYEKNRMIDTPLGWNDPRAVEGELLAKQQFPEEKVVEQEKNLGAYGTAGQLQQRPIMRGGSIFKDWFFNKRVKAAPHDATRVRYWDTAATHAAGCQTVGTLIAKDTDNNFYIEHVIVGQWEPGERDNYMVATAQRDQLKYGPKQEPTIYIEHEPGSAGVTAYKYIAGKLAGHKVMPDRPTGSKEIRAEPFASQCAAGNVFLVEDGSWDISAWIDELTLFPKGKFVDRVDSASGGFGKLVSVRKAGTLRIYPIVDKSKKQPLKIVVCTHDELKTLVIEPIHQCVLITVVNPGEIIDTQAGFTLLESLVLEFADLQPEDFQDRWNEPVPPWNKPPADIVMNRDHGKKIWSLLRRNVTTNAIVIAGHCALTVAYALCDMLHIKRSAAITYIADEEMDHDVEPGNKHVFEMVKSCRGMVV